MKIPCHSSFDNNLKVHVATASGERLETLPTPPTRSASSGTSHEERSANDTPQETPITFGSPYGEAGIQEIDQTSHGSLAITTFGSNSITCVTAPPLDPSIYCFDSFADVDPLSLQSIWDLDFSLDPFAGFDLSNIQAPATTSSYDSADVDPSVTHFRFVSSASDEAYHVDNALPINTPSEDAIGTRAAGRHLDRRKRLQTGDPSPSPLVPGDPGRSSAFLVPSRGTERFLFSYYDTAIRNVHSLKEDAKWNYHAFILAFIQQCTPEFPFRTAVLAWTARHFAAESASDDYTWTGYYAKAHSEVDRLIRERPTEYMPSSMVVARPAISTRAEIVICASLFLCRCNVLAGDYNALSARLQQVSDWLSDQPAVLQLSGFACKVLMWLATLSVRVAIFSPNHNIGPTILDVLMRRRDHRLIQSHAEVYLAEIFGPSYPSKDLSQDAELVPVSRLLHETMCMISSMLQYRAWKSGNPNEWQGRELYAAKIAAIDSGIRRIATDFELTIAANPSASILRLEEDKWDHPTVAICAPIPPDETPQPEINRQTLHWLTCYAVFLTSRIMWSRILHPHIRTDAASSTAVRSILRIALRLRKAKYKKTVRSMHWPLPLFVAGIETTDEIYADWIKTFMEEAGEAATTPAGMSNDKFKQRTRHSFGDGGGQSGGTGGEKVRQLMMEVRKRQSKQGIRVEPEQVIRDMNGELGTFIF